MAEKDQEVGEEKKSSKKLFIIIGAVVAVIIIVVATLYFMGMFSSTDSADDEEAVEQVEEEVASEALYHPLKPEFIVNFPNNRNAKLLQVSITVLSHQETTIQAVDQHMPMIRNNLLMLFSGQDPVQLRTEEGKVELRAAVLQSLQDVIEKQTGSKGVDDVFFTEFVMQ